MSCFVWANGKVSGSGTIIFYICIHRVLVLIWEHHVLTLKVYVIDLSGVWEDCREKIEGFGVSMWVCRRHWGSWECCLSQNWAPTPGKIRPHDTQLQISPGFCIPVCTIAATCSWVTKTFLSSFLPVSIFYSFYFCFLHMQAYRKFCPQLPSNQNFLFCIIDRKNSRYMDLFAGLPD